MSRRRTEVYQNTLEFPLSTEQPARHPIHLLLKSGKAACGRTQVSRAWSYTAWPQTDSTWKKDICVACWDSQHAPLVRLESEVA
jgi:hypothetical protein